MALQIEFLETSFQRIAPQGEAFVTAFYERLFTRFPETRAFFASTDMKEQRKKLLGALALVIQNLRKPEVLTSALQGLGPAPRRLWCPARALSHRRSGPFGNPRRLFGRAMDSRVPRCLGASL